MSHEARRRAPHRKRRRVEDRRDFVGWMMSLPWVIEAEAPSSRSRRRELRIECAPLDVSCSWAVVTRSATDSGPTRLQLLLPDTLQLAVTVAGWFSSVTPTLDGRCICELDLGARHPAELEVVVLSTYSFSFPRAPQT
jgi:hypothetical protein